TINIQRDGEAINPEIAAPINDYFNKTFEATANLQTVDMSELFYDPASVNAILNQNALDYLIKLRLKQSNNLKLTNYQCQLNVSVINEVDEAVEVELLENYTVNFAFIPDVDSVTSGIRHHFWLIKTGNTYKIAEHLQDEDSFNLVKDAISAQPSEPAAVLEDLLSKSTAAAADVAAAKQAFNSGEQPARQAFTGNPYQPEAAVNYAMAWVDPEKTLRNTAQFGIYDDVGGNCNNFISQCLNAGGIPMDIFGDEFTQWKWYSDELNLDETESGRSPAWAGVNEFYLYARENSGYGLSAVVDDNVYSGAVGDILQFGYDNQWLHSVIITQVVKDKDGKVVDYLIHSNTTDRISYPASAYGYPQQRLIKILGWNDQEIPPSE
ncbi:MAG: amidase domain-containing protein, partial [Acetobacterium sp.]|nr:amidase domain-containing protein [Bacillota bacterium]MCG2729920.1 amidase domain-containing protein [Acetobacterium sp.]